MVTPSEAVKTAGGESRRMAAARKKAAAYSDEPSLKEAVSRFHREKWLEAMRDELASLTENGGYEVVTLPVSAAALSAKWVLKIKRGAQGEIERFKARYVVRGFDQVLGKDFHQTWALVGHYTTLRCLLVICVQDGLETVHLDIKCEFQNGKLTDLVYVSQPEELGVVTYAHYACVADCADAMADAWEDTAGCAQTICLHENLLKCQYIVKWGLHGIVHI